MDISLKDNLRNEFLEILERQEYKKMIDHQELDLSLLKTAFDVLLEKEDDDQATAFLNNIINTLKSRNLE
jgi:hypothetical protein